MIVPTKSIIVMDVADATIVAPIGKVMVGALRQVKRSLQNLIMTFQKGQIGEMSDNA